MKKVTEAGACLFRKAYNSDTGGKIISSLYKGLLNRKKKKHSNLYIKTKWEKERVIIISDEDMDNNMEIPMEVHQFTEMKGIWLKKSMISI